MATCKKYTHMLAYKRAPCFFVRDITSVLAGLLVIKGMFDQILSGFMDAENMGKDNPVYTVITHLLREVLSFSFKARVNNVLWELMCIVVVGPMEKHWYIIEYRIIDEIMRK